MIVKAVCFLSLPHFAAKCYLLGWNYTNYEPVSIILAEQIWVKNGSPCHSSFDYPRWNWNPSRYMVMQTSIIHWYMIFEVYSVSCCLAKMVLSFIAVAWQQRTLPLCFLFSRNCYTADLDCLITLMNFFLIRMSTFQVVVKIDNIWCFTPSNLAL